MPTFPGTQTRPPPPRFKRRPRWPEQHEKHEAAQDAIDLATFRRIHDETMSAAYLSARDAPDEASAEKIRERASQSVSAITSQRPQIQQAYARFYEGAQASWGDRFARQAAGIKDKKVNDRARLAYDGYLDEGNVPEALKILELLKIRNPEDAAIIEQEQADTPFKSAERQVFNDIHSGDMARAQRGLADLRGLDTTALPARLLKRRHDMIRTGTAEVNYRQGQNAAELYAGVLKMDAEGLSPLEQRAASQELDQAIQDAVDSGRISPHHGVTLQTARRTSDARFGKGAAIKVDNRVRGMAQEVVMGITTLTTDAEFATAMKWLFDNADLIGSSYQQLVKDAHLNRKQVPDGKRDALVRAMARQDIAPDDRAAFMETAIAETKGKELSPKEWDAYMAERAVGWNAVRKTVPEAKIASILGALQTGKQWLSLPGGMIELRSITTRAEAIAFIYQQGWYDQNLRPEQRARIRRMLDTKYAFGGEDLPLHPTEGGLPEPTGGGALNLRGDVGVAPVAEVPVPPPAEREVGKVYTIRGKQYQWQTGGWKPIP